MDIGKSIGYIFQDRDWLTKVLIGSLILLISLPFTALLVGFLGLAIVAGYSLEVLRNVRQGAAQPLPEWRDRWGEWLMLGLKLGVVLLAWSLPALLLNAPSWLGNALLASDSGFLQLMGGTLSATTSCLAFIWGVIVALATPALFIRLAESEDIASAFQFKDIYAFTRENIGDVIVAVLVALLFSILLSVLGWTVGTLLCLVGLLITVPASIFLTSLITAHLYAQIGASRRGQVQPATVSFGEPEPASGDVIEVDVSGGSITPKSDA